MKRQWTLRNTVHDNKTDEKVQKRQYATYAKQSKATSTCDGAHIKHTQVPLTQHTLEYYFMTTGTER